MNMPWSNIAECDGANENVYLAQLNALRPAMLSKDIPATEGLRYFTREKQVWQTTGPELSRPEATDNNSN